MKSKLSERPDEARREFLRGTALVAGMTLASCAASGAGRAGESAASPRKAEKEEAKVTPGEDLMQEHGLIERILLIYDEAARRIEHNEALDLAVLTGAATIVQRFVGDYHEKTEEQFVFPKLQTAGREVELVSILLRQHQRGREITQDILKASQATATPELASALRNFARMYRPHAAREDTVLFPAFRDLLGGSAYLELGEQFEEKEHQLFGEHGFENMVGEVARLEQTLKIHDLAEFTPP